jgi:hypothetical protein
MSLSYRPATHDVIDVGNRGSASEAGSLQM